MIYALVEPSIYMIASILPTTRHLYRRMHRKARRAAELQYANSNSGPKNSSGHGQSAELEEIVHHDISERGITRHVDIRQASTSSSQEELTMGEWYHDRQEWDKSNKPTDISWLEAQSSASDRETTKH